MHMNTVQVDVTRSVPPQEVRRITCGEDDDFLKYIRDSNPEATVNYNEKNFLGRPEFVIKSSSETALLGALELVKDLMEGVRGDLEKLSKEYPDMPKGKQQWADEDDEDFELPEAGQTNFAESSPSNSTPGQDRRLRNDRPSGGKSGGKDGFKGGRSSPSGDRSPGGFGDRGKDGDSKGKGKKGKRDRDSPADGDGSWRRPNDGERSNYRDRRGDERNRGGFQRRDRPDRSGYGDRGDRPDIKEADEGSDADAKEEDTEQASGTSPSASKSRQPRALAEPDEDGFFRGTAQRRATWY